MDIFTLIFWAVAIVLTIISLVRNRQKTFAAMKKSKGMMGSMLSEILAIIFLIGLVLTFIPPETIKTPGLCQCLSGHGHCRFGRQHYPDSGLCRVSFGRVAGECRREHCTGCRFSDDTHDGGRGDIPSGKKGIR